MPNLNLNLTAEQLDKATHIAARMGINRSIYLRRAIDAYNAKIERKVLAQKFKQASEKCRRESLRVGREFERVANIPD